MRMLFRLWVPVALTNMILGAALAVISALTNPGGPDEGAMPYALSLIFGGIVMFLAAPLYLIWRQALTGKSIFD